MPFRQRAPPNALITPPPPPVQTAPPHTPKCRRAPPTEGDMLLQGELLLLLLLLLPLLLRGESGTTTLPGVSTPLEATALSIATIAGSGTTAPLHTPYGIAVLLNGDLIIAEYGGHRVRLVTEATGVITSIAGTGVRGFSGDSQAATDAQLSDPTSVAALHSGDVYVCDQGNSRVRLISATTGRISTVAGTGRDGWNGDDQLATRAELNFPFGVASAGNGDLFIADYGNARIRLVIASSGFITTIAGTGVAGFSGDSGPATTAQIHFPYGVAVGVDGGVFIADALNSRIRLVAAGSRVITTVAGSGGCAYSSDGVLAIYAKLCNPTDVSVRPNGDLFIADQGNHRVLLLSASTGQMTTLVGTGRDGFNGDGQLAVVTELSYPFSVAESGDGVVHVADTANNRVLRVLLSPFASAPAASGLTEADYASSL